MPRNVSVRAVGFASFILADPYKGVSEASLRLTASLEAAARSVSAALTEYLALPEDPRVREVAVQLMRASIVQELEKVAGTRFSLRVEPDPDWGCVYVITLQANAREALKANLKLQEKYPGIPIVVEWTGETDVTEEELTELLAELLAKGGLRAKAPPGFDAVKAVRESRGALTAYAEACVAPAYRFRRGPRGAS